MTNVITVLLVDANDETRPKLADELTQFNYQVKSVACVYDAQARLHENPDVLITDIDLPYRLRTMKTQGAGLKLGREFRDRNPSTGLLFYCADENHVRAAEEIYFQGQGGVGYVAKESAVRLATVVPAVVSGQWVCVLTKPFVGGASEDLFLQDLPPNARSCVVTAVERIAELSPKERETLANMGKSNQHIASSLNVDIKTVENHFTNIYQRLELDALDRRLRTMLLDRALALYNLRTSTPTQRMPALGPQFRSA